MIKQKYIYLIIISLLVIIIVTLTIMFIIVSLKGECKLIECSDENLYKNYKLIPLISNYTKNHSINECQSWKDMRQQQRTASIKANGDPQNNNNIWGIYNIIYDVDNKLNLRIFPLDNSEGLCIFIHGGGWCIGEYDIQDKALIELRNKTKQTVVSVQYRLVGTNNIPPVTDKTSIPIPNQDCYNAVEYILNNISHIDKNLNKNSTITITGNSAGAQLALATIVHTPKTKKGKCPFTRASFLFGSFIPFTNGYTCPKLSPTVIPPMSGWVHGKDDYPLLTPSLMARFQQTYSNNFSNPHVNVSLTDLRNLCPAQFIVGTEDMTLPLNITMHSLWRLARNKGQLIVIEGMPHGFTGFPLDATKKALAMQYDFLAQKDSKISQYLITTKPTEKWPEHSSPPSFPYFI